MAALACALAWTLLACGCREGAEAPPPPARVPVIGPPSSAQAPDGLEPLGPPPLCEPSTALRAPWDPTLILVADNEVQGALFGFRVVDGWLAPDARLELPGGNRPRDVEALAPLAGLEGFGDDAVLIVGSHSRTKDCEARDKRLRLRMVARAGSGLVEIGFIDDAGLWAEAAAGGTEGCRARLFGDARSATIDAVCEALVAGERGAQGGDCSGAVNIEGAVVAPASGDAPARLWLGLRAPLVEGRAVLLRVQPEGARLRFDAAALVDLGGRGVRELSRVDDALLLIGGPAGDVDEPFVLARLAPGALVPDAALRPEVARDDLPPSSEGLVLAGGHLIVVVDGAEGEDEESPCDVPAGQCRAPWP